MSPHDGITARNQFEFLKDLEAKKGVKVKTVALVYENTEFGSNVAKMQRNYANPTFATGGKKRDFLTINGSRSRINTGRGCSRVAVVKT